MLASSRSRCILRKPAVSCSFCMIKLFRGSLVAITLLLATPRFAAAQLTDIPGFDNVLAQIQERLPDNRILFREAVEMTQGDMRFYADHVEYFGDTNRLVATGNVLLIETDHQIAADRADFNAKTRLGTFYNARGFAAMGKAAAENVGKADVDPSAFATLDPDVQFYGETLEKVERRHLHHHERRLHVVRPGQPAMGDDIGIAQAARRSLRAAPQHVAEGQGRARPVSACHVLPAQQGQSQHRFSDAELRHARPTRGRRSATPFSGRSTAARTPPSCTTGTRRLARRSAGEYRYVSLGGSGNLPHQLSQRTCDHLRARR